MTQSSLFSFTELFSFMMGEEGKHTTRGRVVPPVDVAEVLNVFDKAVKEVDLGEIHFLLRKCNCELQIPQFLHLMEKQYFSTGYPSRVQHKRIVFQLAGDSNFHHDVLHINNPQLFTII